MKDYKKILESIINIINTAETSDMGFANICTYINENCSELAESENKRIRKEIIKLVKFYYGSSAFKHTVSKDEMIDWLEKQGEQSKKVSIWKHWKDGIAGDEEGKQIYLIKNGLTYSISSCLGHECDYIELSELDELLREEKQGNKPKWTEEDERHKNTIIRAIHRVGNITPIDGELAEKWLKSLKQR